MNEWIGGHFSRLSLRERLLLFCLGGMLLPALLIWGLAYPSMERRDAAYHALLIVQAERNWLAQIQAEYVSLTRQENSISTPNPELAGLSGIETSLNAAGLRESIAELGNNADDVFTLRFQNVEFVHLMSWLQAMAQKADYSISRLQLSQGERPGEVAADIQLKQPSVVDLTNSQ